MNTLSSSRRRLFLAGAFALVAGGIALVARSQTSPPTDVSTSLNPSVQMVVVNNQFDFFDPINKRIYVYSGPTGVCLGVYQMDKLGGPIVKIGTGSGP